MRHDYRRDAFLPVLHRIIILFHLFVRGNRLGPSCWTEIMDILEWSPNLTALNSYEQYGAVVDGGVLSLDLNGKELALPLCRFLHRCSETLVSMDLRSIFALYLNFIQSCHNLLLKHIKQTANLAKFSCFHLLSWLVIC